MRANRAKHEGVSRGGHALLGGLVHCGRCGRRMTLGYHNNGSEARYGCSQEAVTFAGPRCQSVSAAPVDQAVGQLILAALTPPALEVSLQLAEDIELERAARRRHWAERLERARYNTALARRRYEAVDPDMRLVARTLERDWEGALAAEGALETEQARELARKLPRLEVAELAVIRQLAGDIPVLWHAATTTQQDRQAIARLVLERVVIRLEGISEHLEVECEWAGSARTRQAVVRPVRRFEQLRRFDQILATIRDLRRQGCSAAVIAERLNAAGWRPPKRAAFEAGVIQRLVFRYGMTGRRPIWSGAVPRQPGAEWTLHEAAERLGIHRHTSLPLAARGPPARAVGRPRRPAHLASDDGGGRTRPTPDRTARPGPHQEPSIERHHGNAVENAFAKLKAVLRTAAKRSLDGLWAAIGRIIDTFTPTECANYFANAGYDAD